MSTIDRVSLYNNFIVDMNKPEKIAVPNEGEGFGGIFSNLLEQANATERADIASSNAILSGNIEDLHTATLDATRAELALSLTIQVRNKVLEAYNEIMRMQV